MSADAYMAAVRTDPENREANDFYPTHPGATWALLNVEKFDGPIWEPACGEGDISRVLQEAGYSVISTDLIERGFGESRRDFLMEWEPHAPNVITNPPFKLATEFIEKSLTLTTGKVAMFLRLAFLEGVERGDLFPSQPLARVWVMSRRVPMWRGEVRNEIGSLMAMAWFVWEHGHQGPPMLGWLDWKDTHKVEPVAALGQIRLIEEAIDRGEITLPIPAAGHAASTQGGPDMAKGKRVEQTSIEVKKPDFEKAVRIFRQDIKPANEKGGEHAQAASTGYKAIKKECRVNTRAAKFVFQLSGESEEKRNDVLRSLRGLLGAMNIGITDDLVSDAEGEDTSAAIVPNAEAERPGLVTVQ